MVGIALSGCKPALRRELAGEPVVPVVPVLSESPEKTSKPENSPPEAARFPMRRTLYNPQGKAIEGEILAKDGERIAFRRVADGGVFVISIFQLSVDDQLFLGNLEDEGKETIQSISGGSESAGEPVKDGTNKGRPIRPLIAREILWHDGLEAGMAASARTGRNLLLVINGDIVLHQKGLTLDMFDEVAKDSSNSINRSVLKDTSFLGFVNSNFEAVHLSYFFSDDYDHKRYEEVSELADQWNLSRLPTFLLINPEGEELGRVEGYDRRGPNLLREKIEAIAGK